MHLQPLEYPEQSRGMYSEGALSLCKGCARAGSWQHLRLEQLMQNLRDPSMVENFWRAGTHGRNPTLEQGKRKRRRKEQQRQGVMD